MEELRKKIEEIDIVLIELLEERMKICKQIGAQKVKQGLSVENVEREKELLEKYTKLGLEKAFVKKIFKEIFAESKRLQTEVADTKR